jgi:hypothetical protein
LNPGLGEGVFGGVPRGLEIGEVAFWRRPYLYYISSSDKKIKYSNGVAAEGKD